MRIGRLTWPWEATASPAGRSVARRHRHRHRHRHGVEYGLVVAIICFASISTFNAISARHSTSSPDPVTVRYQ
jgi:hypothetical protein